MGCARWRSHSSCWRPSRRDQGHADGRICEDEGYRLCDCAARRACPAGCEGRVTGSMPSLYFLNVTVHLLAAFVWLGGMLFLGLVGAPVLRGVAPAALRQQLFHTCLLYT